MQLTLSGRRLELPRLLTVIMLAILWVVAYQSLSPAVDFLVGGILGLDTTSHLGGAIAFFLYDTPKILLLLTAVVFAMGIVRSFFTAEQTRRVLGGKREGVGNALAASLGIVTPFCSCSAVPLFIGFVESGVPLGVTLSFLIAAPMINEIAAILLWEMFGWQIALLYVATGLTIAISAGWVIGRLHMERFVEDWVYQIKVGEASADVKLSWDERINFAKQAVVDIVGKVWLFVVIGIAVGAGIHGYVPDQALAAVMGKEAWWSVPMAVLIGIPMYSSAASIAPVVMALMEKGAALGTVLAFMMAVIGLSLPETIILRRVLKWQLISVFLGVVGVGIVIVGFLFNVVM
jgi:uncharacterized protein